VPFGCLISAGAQGISFDLSLLRRRDEDALGEVAEAGLGLAIGAVQPVPVQPVPVQSVRPGAVDARRDRGEGAARETAATVISLWRRIGLPLGTLTDQVVVTPACGLAGASADRARAVLAQCQAAARLIPELIEEGVP